LVVTGGDDGFAPAHAPQGGCGFETQFPGLGDNQVGNLVGFEMAPHIFHRIEFQRVGRKAFDYDSAMGGQDIVADQHTTVKGRSIPDHQYLPWNVPLQMLQKFDDLEAFDAAGVNLEIELPEGQAADDRKTLPIEGLLENRGLSTRSPGACPGWPGAQAAFVNKDDGAALLLGFFFKAGQVTRRHFRMAFSSRSTARRSGRWQLKPLAPSRRQTCPG